MKTPKILHPSSPARTENKPSTELNSATKDKADTLFNSYWFLNQVTDSLDGLEERAHKATLGSLFRVNQCWRKVVSDKVREAEHSLRATQCILDWSRGKSKYLQVDAGNCEAAHLNLTNFPIDDSKLKEIVKKWPKLVEIHLRHRNGDVALSLKPLQQLRALKKIVLTSRNHKKIDGYFENEKKQAQFQDELGNLPGLEDLVLNLGGLRNLDILTTMVNLEKLALAELDAGVSLNAINQLKNLKALDIKMSPLCGLHADAFAGLSERGLKSLSVSAWKFEPSHFEQICKMKDLTYLYLGSWYLQPVTFPMKLGDLKNLQYLGLRHFLPPDLSESLTKLNKLQDLFIDQSFNHNFKEIPELNLTQLRRLTIHNRSDCGIECGFARLSRLKNLEYLHIDRLKIDDSVEVELPKLKDIYLNPQYINSNFLHRWKMPELEKIHIDNNAKIDSLARYPKITHLVCGGGVDNFCHLPNLEQLDFSLDQFKKLNHLKNLKSLRFHGIIADEHVSTLNSLESLESLSVNTMLNTGGARVWNRLRLPKLKVLDFSWSCLNTHDSDKIDLAHFPNLKWLVAEERMRERFDVSNTNKPVQFLEYDPKIAQADLWRF